MGTTISATKRERIFAKSDGKCWYCGKDAQEVDHIIPVYSGGKDRLENLVPVCKSCNRSKRAYPLDVWRERLALRFGYAFTPEQRTYWKYIHDTELPKDQYFKFYYERAGLS